MKILIVAAVALLIAPHTLAQTVSRSQNADPAGNWNLGCGPTSTPGALVDLYMVGTDSSNGVKVTDLWLRNRTTQDVAAVKIAWKLYERSNPSKTLISGETPQFVGVALAVAEKRVISFPVVSFAKIYGPLMRDGRVDGNFRIEVWVSEVQFDSANVETGNSSSFSVRKAGWRKGATNFLRVSSKQVTEVDDDGAACQNQECGWANRQQCYTCFNNTGSTCSWSNCNYCKSGRCGGLIE